VLIFVSVSYFSNVSLCVCLVSLLVMQNRIDYNLNLEFGVFVFTIDF